MEREVGEGEDTLICDHERGRADTNRCTLEGAGKRAADAWRFLLRDGCHGMVRTGRGETVVKLVLSWGEAAGSATVFTTLLRPGDRV